MYLAGDQLLWSTRTWWWRLGCNAMREFFCFANVLTRSSTPWFISDAASGKHRDVVIRKYFSFFSTKNNLIRKKNSLLCTGVESEMGSRQSWWLPKLFQVCFTFFASSFFCLCQSLSLVFFFLFNCARSLSNFFLRKGGPSLHASNSWYLAAKSQNVNLNHVLPPVLRETDELPIGS